MKTMGLKAMCVLAAFAATPALAAAQHHGMGSPEDRAAVERAGLDYLEGFYEGDGDKLRRSVHPEATKYGFFARNGEYQGTPMSFQEMLDFAANVKESGNHPPATAPKEVEVLEVMDQIAAIRVTAWWGSDYMHLAKYDGEWKIIHVLWQSPPPN